MLCDAGGDGEDVGVEDDVAWVEPDAVHQEVVGAHAYPDFAVLVHSLKNLAFQTDRTQELGAFIEHCQ